MRRILIVAFPDVQTLDVVGPAEVFSMANSLANGGEYDVEVVASAADALTTGSGLKLLPHRSLAAVRGPIDTLLVAGGTGVVAAKDDERLMRFIRSASSRAPRGVRLHGRPPAGRGRPARRPPRDHPLGRV